MTCQEAILAGEKEYLGEPCGTCGGRVRRVNNYNCTKCSNSRRNCYPVAEDGHRHKKYKDPRRQLAREEGITSYHAEPCPVCKNTERLVTRGTCTPCEKKKSAERQYAWFLAHPEENRKKSSIWNHKNRASTKIKHRVHYTSNADLYMLKRARVRAKKKGWEFNLDREDVAIPEFCPVLGMKMEVASGAMKSNSPTLDRLDNKKGYIKGNVMVISQRANMIKSDASIEEIEKVLEFVRLCAA